MSTCIGFLSASASRCGGGSKFAGLIARVPVSSLPSTWEVELTSIGRLREGCSTFTALRLTTDRVKARASDEALYLYQRYTLLHANFCRGPWRTLAVLAEARGDRILGGGKGPKRDAAW